MLKFRERESNGVVVVMRSLAAGNSLEDTAGGDEITLVLAGEPC